MYKEKKKGRYKDYKYRILTLLKDKPLYPYEIEDALRIPHSSTLDCLKSLTKVGWVKKLETGQYALYNYEPLKDKVDKIIELLFPFWLYTNVSIFDFRDFVIKSVAFLDGKYSIDDGYRNSISKLFIEYLEKLDSRHPEWAKILREKVHNKIKEFIKKDE